MQIGLEDMVLLTNFAPNFAMLNTNLSGHISDNNREVISSSAHDLSPRPLHIDVGAVIKERLGPKARFIPRFLVNGLAKFICQDRLNGLLDYAGDKKDARFCRAVLEYLGVDCTIVNSSLLPSPSDKRVVLVCNHPLGALDGMIIIDRLTEIYGPGLKFVVNDLLNAVTPLNGVFLPVNKHGRQHRESVAAVDRAFEGNEPVVVFPAGLVSRRSPEGVIADPQWHKMFVTKAIATRRDVVPLYFDGSNSSFFYNFALWRKRLGIGFNLEMTRLPAEIFRCEGRKFSIDVRPRVSWQKLASFSNPVEAANYVRSIVYSSSLRS